MKITNFYVKKFRSIVESENISMDNYTVLIGKNNEGKSNLLNALSIAVGEIKIYALFGDNGKRRMNERNRIRRRTRENVQYSWDRDYPFSLQEKKSVKQTTFKVTFEFENIEQTQLRNLLNYSVSSNLILKLTINQRNETNFTLSIPKNKKKFSDSDTRKIIRYISEKFIINYIPSIRTSLNAEREIENIISHELSSLNKNKNYKKALDEVNRLEKNELQKIEKMLKPTLKKFVPNIKDISIENFNDRIHRYNSDYEILIDDGTPTYLDYKGDGIKSLTTIALLKERYSKKRQDKAIIAIEEPETHLHSGAIHELKSVVQDLSKDNQVIITTHNPIFVNVDKVSNNIIINNGEAKPAQNKKEIRDILGIKVSDNLTNANSILLVEGKLDVDSMSSLLCYYSNELERKILSGEIVIVSMDGADNLPYQLTLINNNITTFHILLDRDQKGKQVYEKMEKENIINSGKVTFTTCPNQNESEFEDWIELSLYKDYVETEYNLNIAQADFIKKKKWSQKMKKIFENNGRIWTKTTEEDIKLYISKKVSEKPQSALKKECIKYLDGLVETMEKISKEEE